MSAPITILTPNEERPGLEPSRSKALLGALTVCGFCLIFIWPWWNRYLPITGVWHFFYAQQILRGDIPYRDFYLFVPPLLPLEIAAAIRLFGNYLAAPELVGVVEVAVLSLALYWWLKRLFSVFHSVVATLFAMAIYLQNYTESLSSLHQIAIVYPVLAGVCASIALDEPRSWRYAGLAGVFSGISFLGKQTSGIGITFSLLILLPLLTAHLKGFRGGARALVAFLCGWAGPVGAVSLWLASNHALGDAVAQVFLKGASSKGSTLDMLSRPFRALVSGDSYVGKHALIAVILLALVGLLCRRQSHVEDRADRNLTIILFGSAALAAFGLAFWLSRSMAMPLPEFLTLLPKDVGVLFGELGCAIVFLGCVRSFYRRQLTQQRAQYLLLSGVSVAVAFMLSLSWGVYVSMIIPGFSFLVALILSTLDETGMGKAAKTVIVAGCLVCIVEVAWLKLDTPYAWGGWVEPNVKYALVSTPYPELRGIRMSAATADFVTRITQEIDEHSRPGQPIFVFPHMPIFYVLAHRRPSTFAYVHFIDVAPDYIARADLQRLMRNPPAVIVYFDYDWRQGESIFRNGQRSGQSDMAAAIKQLSTGYQLLDTLKVPSSKTEVRVWVKQ